MQKQAVEGSTVKEHLGSWVKLFIIDPMTQESFYSAGTETSNPESNQGQTTFLGLEALKQVGGTELSIFWSFSG